MTAMNVIRVIFADFDGVLNSHEYMRNRAPESERGSVMGLDRLAVARLNRLVTEAKAEVVVSSTWRHNRSTSQLCDALVERGFEGTVRGRTPRWIHGRGGLEAAKCRGEEYPDVAGLAPDYGLVVESFVILDDDSDMGHLADRLVKTSFEGGLLDEHVDRAIAMLRESTPLIVLPMSTVSP